jgi:hypothetical protein
MGEVYRAHDPKLGNDVLSRFCQKCSLVTPSGWLTFSVKRRFLASLLAPSSHRDPPKE